MHDRITSRRTASAVISAVMTAVMSAMAAAMMTVALLVGLAAPARAQAWDYPSFQQSHTVDREFNFAVATSGHDGTSFLIQWREGVVPGQQQFSVDAGIATANGNAIGFFGGTYALQFINQTAQQPLELLGDAGAGLAFGSGGTLFRIPVGVSVGHRFPLQGNIAITPYVHPDLALGFCSGCGAHGNSRTDLGLGIGFGANLEVTPQIALRLDTSFGSTAFGTSNATVGFGLAWSPTGLRKPK